MFTMNPPHKIADHILENWTDWLPNVLGTEHEMIVETAKDMIEEAVTSELERLYNAVDLISKLKDQTLEDIVNEDRCMDECVNILDDFDDEFISIVEGILKLNVTDLNRYIRYGNIVHEIQQTITEQELHIKESEIYVRDFCEDHNLDFGAEWSSFLDTWEPEELADTRRVEESMSHHECLENEE